MRDARLFLGISFLPLLYLVSLGLWSLWHGPGTSLAVGPSADVVNLMALCAWTGLLTAAVYKLLGAQNVGADFRSCVAMEWTASVSAALMTVFWIVHALPEFIRRDEYVGLAVIPALSLACPMILRLAARGKRRLGPGARATYVFGLAQLWLAYGLTCTLLSQEGIRSLLDARWADFYAPGQQGYMDGSDESGLYFPPTTEFRCLVWFVPWSVGSAFACSLLALWLSSIGWRKTSFICAMASALWSSLFLALMANLLPFDFSITRFAVLAAVPALVVGIVLGNYVARRWKCERVAWRHRVAVASLLALVFSCIVVPVAGMGAAALLPFRPGEPQRIWAWYLPECVRRPIAAAYVAQWPQCTFNLLGWGLLPTDIVRGFALTFGRDIRPWHAWSERDPEALSFALAVGETETPTQPAGSHDFGAGFLIGELGSADDVRMRLEGAYSDELVCGLACGLSFRLPGEQTAVPSEAFVRRFERMADQNAMEWIGTPLLVHAPERLNMYLRRCIDDPTPTNLTRLKALLYAWGQGDRDCALTVCALQSDSVELRKLALLSLRWNYLQGHARRVLSPCLLRALQARNSNTDADEQRLAMYCCEFMFSGGSLRLQAFPARVADAPIPPLDTYDNEVLGRWVKRLKEDHPIQ